MLDTKYQLQDGTLNTIYDKVYNCRVVKPTFEVNGLYSDKFMLDKRLGSVAIPALSKPGYTFLDVTKVNGEKYYLAEKDARFHLFHQDGTLINSTGIDKDSNSPTRLLKGKGAGGTLITSGILSIDAEALDDVSSEGLFDSGWIKLQVSGCSVGQYIVFTDGLLKGATNRIEHVDGNNIYIIGTNTRGTLPVNGQGYKVFSERKQTILVGGTAGLFLFHVDGNSTNNTPINILPVSIIDMVIFNGQVLALSEAGVYYSKSTYDGNTNIYPRDILKGYAWDSLINIGTGVIAMGEHSELIKDIVSTDGSIGYVSHELQVTSNLHSKYSYIYKDGIFMLLTDSQKLPTVDIQSVNNTLSRTIFQYSDSVFRGLFESIEGDVYVNNDGIFSNIITHKDGKTTIYELDFEYKHWIIHTYDYLIYKKVDGEILGQDGVYSIEGYQDLGNDYDQEVNLSHGDTMEIVSPYKFIRTIVGATDDKIELSLEIVLEFARKIITINHVFKNFDFEIGLDDTPGGDELLGYETTETYDGTFASLQKSINRTGRYMRCKYKSTKRVIFGETIIFYEMKESKVSQELDTSE